MSENKNLYPQLIIKNNEHPNRWLAIPFLGIIFKTIILIPVFIEVIGLGIAALFFYLAVPFVILFTGNYWDSAYDFFLGYFKFSTKITLYYAGLTDKYPGFSLSDDGIFSLKIDKPQTPSRLMAFPILGYIIRYILLIPYLIFSMVLVYGMSIAVFISWFIILFSGRYPESIYEFICDTQRITLAQVMYFYYLSDTYPSFYISMKHKTIKILLIIAGVLYFLSRVYLVINNFNHRRVARYNYYQNNHYNYQNKPYKYPVSNQP